MAENVDIKILIDTAQSANNLKALKDAQAGINAELQKTDVNSKAFKTLSQARNETTGKIGKLEDSIKNAGKTGQTSFGKFKDGFKDAISGAGGFGSAFSSLSKLFLTNPIGIVVAAVVALVSQFKRLEPVMNVINGIMGAIDATIDALIGNIDSVFSGLGKILTLDFSGAAEDFNKVGDAIKNQASAAYNLVEALDNLDEAQTKNIVNAAELEAAEKNLLIQSKNKTLSEKERISLIEQARQKGLQAFEAEKQLSKQRIEAALLELKTVDKKSAKYDELNKKYQETIANDIQLDGKRADINEKYDNKQAELSEKRLAEEQAAKDKSAAIYQKRKEDAIKATDDAVKAVRELQNKAYLDSITDEKLKARETLRLQQESATAELNLKIKTLEKTKGLTKEELAELKVLKQESMLLRNAQVNETKTLIDKQNADEIKTKLDASKKLIEIEDKVYFNKLSQFEQTLANIDKETEETINGIIDAAKASGKSIEDVQTSIQIADENANIKRAKALEDKNKEDAKNDVEKKIKDAKDIEDARLKELKIAAGKVETARQVTSALSSLNDLVTNLENRNLKEGEVASVKVQKEQFIRSQTLAATNAAINTASAVIAALVTPGPAGVAQSIFAGITGAASIATILSKKFEPKVAKFAQGGILDGPSHSQGGIQTRFGELEGGEIVLTKGVAANPKLLNIASHINSLAGGVKFADGGVLQSSSSNNSNNNAEILQAILEMNNRPIKTYVVESEMTEIQKRRQKIRDEASF